MLQIFRLRCRESQTWKQRKSLIISQSDNTSHGKHCQEDVVFLLQVASHRNIETEEIFALLQLVTTTLSWQTMARGK